MNTENANISKLTEDSLWHEITHNYYSVLEVKHEISPWDIYVRLAIPVKTNESKAAGNEKVKRGAKVPTPSGNCIVDLSHFFARYPELSYTNVVFIQPTLRATANKHSVITDLLAVFGETKFKTLMEIPRNKKTQAVVASKSRSHALQLLYMFNKKAPGNPGEAAELFIKLTPVLEGDDRKAKRVWKMSLFSLKQIKEVSGKGKPPRIAVKRAAKKK